jgi:hypothetical protein
MAPFGKGGGPQDRGIFASIFMRSVAVTNCILIRGAKDARLRKYSRRVTFNVRVPGRNLEL